MGGDNGTYEVHPMKGLAEVMQKSIWYVMHTNGALITHAISTKSYANNIHKLKACLY